MECLPGYLLRYLGSNNSRDSGALRGRCGAPCTGMCCIRRNDHDDNGDNTGGIIACKYRAKDNHQDEGYDS
jgi:hypothetical protein